MSDQPRSTFERHPHYDQPYARTAPAATAPPAAGVPPTHAPGGVRNRAGLLIAGAGVALAVLVVVMGYVTMRWMEDPLGVFLVLVGVSLVVLAVLALLAGRHRVLAPFVAIALTLPFFTVLTATIGLGQRIDDGLEGWFGSSDDSGFSLGGSTDVEPDTDETIALGDEGVSGNFTVVVQGVECSTTLAEARDNPDYYSVDDAPQYLDAKAPAGKQFCVVSSTWTNTSQEPDMIWSGLGKVVTADGTTYAATEDDSEYTRRLSAQAGYESSTLNPGDAAELRSVFTLPADVEVTDALAEGFGFDEPTLRFALG